MRDFYEVLGVAKDATSSDIKKAYRRLAMEFHPDRNPDDQEAEEKFKEASNAYKVLADQDQRARYDQYGHAGLGRQGGFEGFSGVDDIFSAFGDLFGDFFGGARGRGPRRGADLQVRLALTFAEAVHGCNKEVEVARKRACSTCDGSGAAPGTKADQCSVCNGAGQVMHSQGFFMIQTTCPNCRGEGKVIESKCKTCKGAGTELETSSLAVSVPAGVDTGQTLRLAHKGQAAPRGGQPGHLYVVLEVGEDERFLREAENVLCPITVSYLQACLGGEIEAPTLEDECEGTMKLNIEPGTQPGDVVVQRGKGIPIVSGRGRGDLIYQFKVEIPTKLSAKERDLLKSLADESGVKVGDGKRGLFKGRRNKK